MDKTDKLKIIIISFLSVSLIVLFYFYLSSEKNSTINNSVQTVPTENIKDKLVKDLDSIIFTFGIWKEWIRDASIKDSKNKTTASLISKEVLIPVDLPAVELNYEITNYLRIAGLTNEVTEDPRTKNIKIEILKPTVSEKDSAMQYIGNLNFIYTSSIKRNAAVICIILDSIEFYSLDDAEKILSSTLQYSVFLPLRNDKADFQSKISELKRDYLIKFSIGDENDVEADFKADMKENSWKQKIKSMNLSFPNISGLIFTHKSGLNEFEEEMIKEFTRNNLNVFKDTMITRLKADANKVNYLFEDIVSKLKNGKKFLIYAVNFNPGEFAELDSRTYALKKSGNKFVSFKDLLKLRNKIDIKTESNRDSSNVENKK